MSAKHAPVRYTYSDYTVSNDTPGHLAMYWSRFVRDRQMMPCCGDWPFCC